MVLDNTNYLNLPSIFANEIIGDWYLAILIAYALLFYFTLKYRFPASVTILFIGSLTLITYSIVPDMVRMIMSLVLVFTAMLLTFAYQRIQTG